MTISSRTPEGQPNRCPLCDKEVRIEPSTLFGDAPCPHCGQLLWFVNIGTGIRFYDYDSSERLRERLREFIAEQLGVSVDSLPTDSGALKIPGADSLDMAELLMELEEEFGDECE